MIDNVATRYGMLIVLTGASGAGKDLVMEQILKHELMQMLQIRRVITNTDRPIRDGEPVDAYHFVSTEELEQMAKNNLLVEPVTQTGSSGKATSRQEIAQLLSEAVLLWRIDPSRAATVASGEFYKTHFPEHAQQLMERTLVICINAPKEIIEDRRKKRDREKYNPEEYRLRDEQEAPHLKVLAEKAVIIENPDGSIEKTIETVVKTIINHHEKFKNKKS